MEKATKRRGNAAAPAAAGGSLSEGIRENQLLPLVEAEIIRAIWVSSGKRICAAFLKSRWDSGAFSRSCMT